MSQILYATTVAENIGIPRGSRLLNRAVRAAARLRARLELARARRIVRVLDGRQLADAGIDASTFVAPRPTFTVETSLMVRLMSMR